MSQTEAVVKALEILGGRSELKWITLVALNMEGVCWENAVHPEANIRRIVRHTPGQIRVVSKGVYELCDYSSEIARLRKENEVKDGLIVYMRSEAYQIVIISNWMKRYMNICKKKSQNVRESIQKSIADIATRLKFNYTDDTQEILNRFDDEKTPEITFIKKEYKDNATSADIEIPGIKKQELIELLSAQQHNLIDGNSQKQLEQA